MATSLTPAKCARAWTNLHQSLRRLGYIKFTAVPDTEIDDAQETHQPRHRPGRRRILLVRRIEFTGNTTTRDKVIRREMPLEEGGVYNSKLWEFGLLRLNQLQYFDELKTGHRH